ncbi:DUF300-domain-containing protein [Gymnopus androsaceus JB14]|uniref:DUF300-domain-containing protein n=1 Tax=Gymnopus androsaceus JB14 TaxID=1447944 RepID=A0A6A4HTR3_9AGAR|nr:DUF300-domain-containing protein [Gymnopus androsaceus JB14]
MANITDGRCWTQIAPSSPSLVQNGNLVFQAHDCSNPISSTSFVSQLIHFPPYVGWIVAGFFTIVAIITSAWLINKHLLFYTDKREQRYIIRILFMVPIYAIISMASYLFWNESTPLLLIRDGYESTVLTSFFYLMLNYLSHDPDEQRAIFLKNGLSRESDREALRKGEAPSKWMFPLGFVKWKPRDGLLFLQIMKWGVLQYCVIRPTTTLAAVILNYMGLYCEDSWSPGWGHVYITIIVSISVTVAMYCLLQLYMPVSKVLAPQKPLLKLFSVKAIVFLTFWQATFVSVLQMFGVIKDTTYMTADDISIGIEALAETFEMMLFGFLHIKAFTYIVYRPGDMDESKELPAYRMTRLRALGHAMDFRETFRELWIGTIYLWDKMRGHDPAPDINARRVAHYESAFGAPRPSGMVRREQNEKEDPLAFPMIRVEREYYDSTQGRQWLGYGNDYGYGVHREKSDDLETQIERELERRGYGSQIPGRGHIKPADTEDTGYTHQRQKSWWRSIYNRISQSGPEDDSKNLTPAPSRRASRRKSKPKSREPSKTRSREVDVDRGLLAEHRYDMDDPPPPSLFRSKRSSGQNKAGQGVYSPVSPYGDEDMLAPLSVFNDHQSSYLQRQSHQRNSGHKHGSKSVVSSPMSPANYPSSPPPPFPSSPPPQSFLAPMTMAHDDVSAESLFGRVFPSKSSDANPTAHGTDNTHSTGYVRNTPRTALPSIEGGHGIGMAAERRPRASPLPNIPQAMSAAVVNPVSDMNPDQSYSEASHTPYFGPRPATTPAMQAPGPAWISQQPYPSPITTPTSGSPRRPPQGLRRSSAQVYSPREGNMSPTRREAHVQPPARSSPPRQSKRHSTPVILTIPRPLVSHPESTYSANHKNRSPNSTNPLNNSSSTVVQPSFSRTMDDSKFPAPDHFLEDDLSTVHDSEYSRYPGMPNRNSNQQHQVPLTSQQQAQSNQRAYKYPSHSHYNGFRGGANNSSSQDRTLANAKDQPRRGPWS